MPMAWSWYKGMQGSLCNHSGNGNACPTECIDASHADSRMQPMIQKGFEYLSAAKVNERS